jgi:hypothetical protein
MAVVNWFDGATGGFFTTEDTENTEEWAMGLRISESFSFTPFRRRRRVEGLIGRSPADSRATPARERGRSHPTWRLGVRIEESWPWWGRIDGWWNGEQKATAKPSTDR